MNSSAKKKKKEPYVFVVVLLNSHQDYRKQLDAAAAVSLEVSRGSSFSSCHSPSASPKGMAVRYVRVSSSYSGACLEVVYLYREARDLSDLTRRALLCLDSSSTWSCVVTHPLKELSHLSKYSVHHLQPQTLTPFAFPPSYLTLAAVAFPPLTSFTGLHTYWSLL